MVKAVSGILYFLSNPAMPGLIKIGYTRGAVSQRVKQLNTTGTPMSFAVAAQFRVIDPDVCEKKVHAALSHLRSAPNREFFTSPLADLLKTALPIIAPYVDETGTASIELRAAKCDVDEDDIYFMHFLLHDGYEQNIALSTLELVHHHNDYAPLELEYKLLKLEDKGMVKQCKLGGQSTMSSWRLTSEGLKFMFEGGHVSEILLSGAR